LVRFSVVVSGAVGGVELTQRLTVPVGVPEPEPGATSTVMVSPTPITGALVAGDSVVVEAVCAEPAGQAPSNLLKSMEPRPEAKS
jgi:hypothetical protein